MHAGQSCLFVSWFFVTKLLPEVDLKFDNLFFRPADIESKIVHELTVNPSRLYSYEGVPTDDLSPVPVHSVSQPIVINNQIG